MYRVDASAQSHILSPKYVSKTPNSGDETVFVSEIPSQLTKLHLQDTGESQNLRNSAHWRNECWFISFCSAYFQNAICQDWYVMSQQDNTDSNRICSSGDETWQEAWPPNARQATLGRKQPDNEWVLDFISESDNKDFVTKKPKGKRACGGRRARASSARHKARTRARRARAGVARARASRALVGRARLVGGGAGVQCSTRGIARAGWGGVARAPVARAPPGARDRGGAHKNVGPPLLSDAVRVLRSDSAGGRGIAGVGGAKRGD